MPTREPLPPDTRHLVPEPPQRFAVTGDSEVREVTTQLLAQCLVLFRDRPMAVDPTPRGDLRQHRLKRLDAVFRLITQYPFRDRPQ